MQNPFNHENYSSNELKRNTFPCSFQNNLTMKYGYIYPAGIWRTVPGATYKIKPTLGLNFMPTTFPVQTRQKVYVHYFYGRDRNFWKDYKDFVNGQRPDLVKPYIDESITKARTGKLLDYLGVPTTIVGKYSNYLDIPFSETQNTSAGFPIPYRFHNIKNAYRLNSANPRYYSFPLSKSIQSLEANQFPNALTSPTYDVSFAVTTGASLSTHHGEDILGYYANVNNITITNLRVKLAFTISLGTDVNSWLNGNFFEDEDLKYHDMFIPRYKIFSIACYDENDNLITYLTDSTLSNQGEISFTGNVSGVYKIAILFNRSVCSYVGDTETNYNLVTLNSNTFVNCIVYPVSMQYQGNASIDSDESYQVRDIDDDTSPYWRSGTTDLRERIKLNAYLPRFYETVYNLYYRNPQNNPYILDGRPEYNKFIPSKDGGADFNLYELRRRNWEDDFLTTAVQSPQQGIAPLVGLTDRGATLTLTNDDGTVTRYNVTTTDNGSIIGFEANDTNAEPVLTKALIDAVSYGISIEDIRNVNAMQKWLELNLRKGYQYKDIIQARWGISISYNELDLPEFIGGFTKDVQLQAVTQTANINDDVTGQLGWQAGRLYAQGEGREITHYCDEEGYIMCLITVVPVPNYSQLLPKHWFEHDLLDSYQPEFNHIGFQPITYKEVCPVQAFQESTENVNVLEQTFGYQRPWYQYFNYTDEVHGQFRTTFKDFLINRVFDVKPELSESFLLVDPEQVNDVFNVPDVEDDKIIGAIYHNCVAKLPISLYAQARLE